MNNYYKGILAEFYTKIILLFKGYRILETRFKSSLGEIDIICQKDEQIIFIEVKSRKDQAQFLDVITAKQKNRIIRSSQIFLKKRKLINIAIRYDVVLIKFPFYIRHIKNAFWES